MGALSTYVAGFALTAAFGVAHHFALAGILRIAPHHGQHPKSGVVVTFVSLLALHTAEFTALAAVNHWLLGAVFPDAFEAPPAFADTLYLTGIAFTTLGYASLEASGGFRMLLLFQSLLGFMLLTWSATFLFSACQKTWQQEED
ncbi:ion channel [Palleronia pelagia]|uniref:Potassium channel domain-containing protein n=1 Tax=Palleronia pelagia TaxID=387096 RepID=A0A1H8MBZ6_9RHOB|nr:ion channel [Palleronia pelagia]SEO14738.1 hypothetical protein SAMN04488011_1159 [Palleronia pelagia]